MNPVLLLRAAVFGTEGDDFIEHKKRAVLVGPFAHRADKLRRRRLQAHAMRQQVEQHACQIAAVLIQQGDRSIDIVEWDNHYIVHRRLRLPMHQCHAIGVINTSPVGR